MKIEATKEEARILMCAIAGMELFAEERKAIRPLYMRLLYEIDPDSLKPEVRAQIEREIEVEVVTVGHIVMCATCNDTHRMKYQTTGDVVMCTHCPVPCEECRTRGTTGMLAGPYCATTPCLCACHQKIGVAK